jgi:antitoxin component YwqK of YwqJK toxin-antitoxin module
MKAINNLIVLFIITNSVCAQNTTKDMLVFLKQAQPNKYYTFQLNDTYQCLIKFDKNQSVMNFKLIPEKKNLTYDTLYWKKKKFLSIYSKQNGLKQGVEITLKKGVLMNLSSYSNDSLDGTSYFYGTDKTLGLIANYAHGKQRGIETIFSKGGKKKSENYYSYGEHNLLDSSKSFYPNGSLQNRFIFYTDYYVRDFYHENGMIHFRDTLDHNDIRIGSVKVYFNNGKPEEISYYKNGKLEGKVIKYYENGNIKEEVEFNQGVIVNEIKYYNEQGKLFKKEIYQNGKLVKKIKITS